MIPSKPILTVLGPGYQGHVIATKKCSVPVSGVVNYTNFEISGPQAKDIPLSAATVHPLSLEGTAKRRSVMTPSSGSSSTLFTLFISSTVEIRGDKPL